MRQRLFPVSGERLSLAPRLAGRLPLATCRLPIASAKSIRRGKPYNCRTVYRKYSFMVPMVIAYLYRAIGRFRVPSHQKIITKPKAPSITYAIAIVLFEIFSLAGSQSIVVHRSGSTHLYLALCTDSFGASPTSKKV